MKCPQKTHEHLEAHELLSVKQAAYHISKRSWRVSSFGDFLNLADHRASTLNTLMNQLSGMLDPDEKEGK